MSRQYILCSFYVERSPLPELSRLSLSSHSVFSASLMYLKIPSMMGFVASSPSRIQLSASAMGCSGTIDVVVILPSC